MINITYLTGDATDPVVTREMGKAADPRIIAHVCNDLGGWGAGFVLALSAKWPQPEKMYREYARNDMIPLGQVIYANVSLPNAPGDTFNDIFVANMVAQHGYRSTADTIPLDYNALATCLSSLRHWCIEFTRIHDRLPSVHMPRIGCGLAGGTWDKVEAIIIEMLSAYDIPVYVYDLP